MRPVFDGMEPELNELMWKLLLPFTASSAARLEELSRVERGKCDEWLIESPEARITCTPGKLTREEKHGGEGERGPSGSSCRLRRPRCCWGAGCSSAFGGSSRRGSRRPARGRTREGAEMVGVSLLPGRETPYTDFRVEESDGVPSAVFDRIPAEQSSLLSYFLYPDKAYAGSLYMDVLKVAGGAVPWMSYEDDFFTATFRPDGIELETKEPPAGGSTPAKVTLSTDDAKYLLLKWGVVCALRERTGEDALDGEFRPEQGGSTAD